MEDEDDFFDTISVASSRQNNNTKRHRDYISLSRNTVYHSAIDLDNMMELTPLDASFDAGDGGDDHRNKKTWHYFTKKNLKVDFVLAYKRDADKSGDIAKRNTFEENLNKVGLILEREENQHNIQFLKIHVPREVLCQYAEILKIRLPIRLHTDSTVLPKENIVATSINRLLDFFKVRLDQNVFPDREYTLTAEFSRDKNYLFDVDREDFFNSGVRIAVISYILEREPYGRGECEKGIKNLLSHDVYKAAYPLHDGQITEEGTQRSILFKHWAQVGKFVKYQPLDEIKEYFGVKIALYFAWLGFYTHMLIPASIVGIICIIYAATTLHSNSICQDICNLDVWMCPRCDKYCEYWRLNETCTYAKIQHFIDNPSTIFFAVFMSFWSILYLELWKRYSAAITHRWGLTGLDLQAEPPRPEYLMRLSNAKRKKLNVITLLEEPAVSFWRVKLPSIILSFTIVLIWMFITLCAVTGVVVYRMSLFTSEALYKDGDSYRIYVVPCTSAVINLIFIQILNFFYNRLAIWLTEMELHRTQTEYEDSLSLKIYMFQFVNYYSSIFYIAFLKGKFVGYPAKYNRIFGFRQEECNPGGCLMELTIQLAIIMIGNQAIGSITEILVPLLYKVYNKYIAKKSDDEEPRDKVYKQNQWTEDYHLSDFQSQSLFNEYLEMVLQYGFVTIFVTAFPLAPLFALINNVLEMRLDAKKFIKYFRRPVPQRVKNIGVWFPIMAIVGRISVVSNAFIIAFSSHFIPKLVYTLTVSPTHTDDGFLNSTLAYFDTNDFQVRSAPENSMYNLTQCRYAEYRNPPDDAHPYKRPLLYWHVLAARLAFVVVYQNTVTFLITAVEWLIPDIPRKVNDQIKREAYQINNFIIEYETMRAQEKLRGRRNRDSVLSGDSVYYEPNGGLRSNRSTIYHDAEDDNMDRDM